MSPGGDVETRCDTSRNLIKLTTTHSLCFLYRKRNRLRGSARCLATLAMHLAAFLTRFGSRRQRIELDKLQRLATPLSVTRGLETGHRVAMLILAALTLLTSTASRALRVYCRRLRKLPTLTLMAAASSRPRLCRLLCWCWQTSEASLLLRSLPGLSRVECEAPDALTKRTRLKQAYSLQKW